MAGFVLGARQVPESAGQLSSQTEVSPCHYPAHKAPAGMLENTAAAAPEDSFTDVETGTAMVTRPARTVPIDTAKLAAARRDMHRSQSANGHRGLRDVPAWGGDRMARRAERHASRQARAHVQSKPHRSLVGPRLFGSAHGAVPTHSHYEKAMRRSAHRMVSATTQFDSVSAGALAMLADVARLYLMRIGDAAKARADLAGRTDPNVCDVLGSGDAGACVELDSLCRWLGDWKGEAGDAVSSVAPPVLGHSASVWARGFGGIADVPPGHRAMGVLGNGFGEQARADAAEDEMDAIINDLDLSCLLLDGAGVAYDFEGIAPPHLPQMVHAVEDCTDLPPRALENGNGASATPPSPVPLAPHSHPAADMLVGSDGADTAVANEPSHDAAYGSDVNSQMSDGEEDTPENLTAQVLHLVSSSLMELNPSIAAGSALSSFFRPASKADPTCDIDSIIPGFEIPEPAFVPGPDHIKSQLARAEKLEPGPPIYLSSAVPHRDTLGDVEEQWRFAKDRLYADIYDAAAERAVEEMDNAPVPVRRRRLSNASEKEEQQRRSAAGEKAKAAGLGNELEMDINIDEDVMDIDMDLDIMGGPADHKAEPDDQEVHERAAHGLYSAAAQSAVTAVEEDVEEVAPEPIAMPISSGLRGSGRPHWSTEWFSAAMRKRLSRVTAQEIVPCDSLFMSSPSASHRHVLDEVARAFVDSEGGGHLHETTPLEGFGPSANTYTVPSASGSALRWTLHHLMQARGVKYVDSLYTGRSSLAGGVSGNGVGQYVSRMCSLVRGSAEEEAQLVVSGAVRAAGDPGGSQWANRSINPTQRDLMEQLLAGVEKRVPWAQEKLDIHILESKIAGREPHVAAPKPAPAMSFSAAPSGVANVPPTVPATPAAASVSSPAVVTSPPDHTLPEADSASPLAARPDAPAPDARASAPAILLAAPSTSATTVVLSPPPTPPRAAASEGAGNQDGSATEQSQGPTTV
ncbi:hypothetical protein H4R19_002045 [Coemansia spiralis]|nr:hypothetical protein H4R19_002045 [Coemansia spiralis]